MNEPAQAPPRCYYCGREHPRPRVGAPRNCVLHLGALADALFARLATLSDRVTELEHPGWRERGSMVEVPATMPPVPDPNRVTICTRCSGTGKLVDLSSDDMIPGTVRCGECGGTGRAAMPPEVTP